uniref:Uncharacterized protein n=1 Tax=Meloidogyne enterolobii TaxID=390850 RepID=A0A6V7UIJ4_MELEN|nr:unnamed protein product [Meloidogyne enterolobii]
MPNSSSEFSFADNLPRHSLTPSNAASSFSSATKLFGNNNTENGLATATSLLTTLTESSAILVRRLSKAFFQAQNRQRIGGSLFLFCFKFFVTFVWCFLFSFLPFF